MFLANALGAWAALSGLLAGPVRAQKVEISVDVCPDRSICVGGSCTTNVVSVDPYNCGFPGNSCQGGELCVAGSCQPLNFSSTDPGDCGSGTPCAAGQWCDSQNCQPIQVLVDPLHCTLEGNACKSSQLCVIRGCVDIDIGSDPYNCGKPGNVCPPSQWCFQDQCTPFRLGTNSKSCSIAQDCPLHADCVNGICSPLFVNTDSYNCGTDRRTCSAGELCVSGGCRALNLTETDGESCGSSGKRCQPGNFCWEDECLLLFISIDASKCGNSVCENGQLCVSGICTQDLAARSLPGAGLIACDSTGIGSQGPDSGSPSPDNPSEDGGSTGEPGQDPAEPEQDDGITGVHTPGEDTSDGSGSNSGQTDSGTPGDNSVGGDINTPDGTGSNGIDSGAPGSDDGTSSSSGEDPSNEDNLLDTDENGAAPTVDGGGFGNGQSQSSGEDSQGESGEQPNEDADPLLLATTACQTVTSQEGMKQCQEMAVARFLAEKIPQPMPAPLGMEMSRRLPGEIRPTATAMQRRAMACLLVQTPLQTAMHPQRAAITLLKVAKTIHLAVIRSQEVARRFLELMEVLLELATHRAMLFPLVMEVSLVMRASLVVVPSLAMAAYREMVQRRAMGVSLVMAASPARVASLAMRVRPATVLFPVMTMFQTKGALLLMTTDQKR